MNCIEGKKFGAWMSLSYLVNQMKKFEKVLIFFPMYKLSCMHIRFLSANLRIVARDILLLRDDALVILSTAHAIHNVAKMYMNSHYLVQALLAYSAVFYLTRFFQG